MTIEHVLVINILVAMFALVEAFEKQKKTQMEKERKLEEEMVKKDKELTAKEKKAKIKKLQPKKEPSLRNYGRLG